MCEAARMGTASMAAAQTHTRFSHLTFSPPSAPAHGHKKGGRFSAAAPFDIFLQDYLRAARFTSFFAFSASAESFATALLSWLFASARLPSLAAITARR